MMRFASLGSGSAGNAMVIQNASTALLLDCGFGLREVLYRLQRLNLNPEQITGILVTHEHEDHAKGVFKLAAKYNIPIWLTQGSFKMCKRYLADISVKNQIVGQLPADLQANRVSKSTQRNAATVTINIIDSHTSFSIQDILVSPYPVPHDAREPTQFTFTDGQHKLGVLTDVGASTPHIEHMLNACDALILECNHDANMLEQGAYPYSLKKRVGGRLGHLDNTSAAHILATLDQSKLKHVIAAHLSAKNNTPQLARMALSQVLGCDLNWVGIAAQEDGFEWRSFS